MTILLADYTEETQRMSSKRVKKKSVKLLPDEHSVSGNDHIIIPEVYKSYCVYVLYVQRRNVHETDYFSFGRNVRFAKLRKSLSNKLFCQCIW